MLSHIAALLRGKHAVPEYLSGYGKLAGTAEEETAFLFERRPLDELTPQNVDGLVELVNARAVGMNVVPVKLHENLFPSQSVDFELVGRPAVITGCRNYLSGDPSMNSLALELNELNAPSSFFYYQNYYGGEPVVKTSFAVLGMEGEHGFYGVLFRQEGALLHSFMYINTDFCRRELPSLYKQSKAEEKRASEWEAEMKLLNSRPGEAHGISRFEEAIQRIETAVVGCIPFANLIVLWDENLSLEEELRRHKHH